ncbi:MAG: hypothetical protein ACO280_06785 [Pseudohongiellaceae bacterium]|jgi:hypothetical protein
MARREITTFSMSYLDVMCCGFGAMILLFMLVRNQPEGALEVAEDPRGGSILDLQKQLFEIRGETNIFNRDLNAKQEQLSQYTQRIARLETELAEVQKRLEARSDQAMDIDTEAGQLALARQSLTDEMRRLQESQQRSVQSDSVGGVPVDSEYVVFVIDTSGSMFNYSWNRLLQVVTETLEVYPQLKGIQVMNDEGDYMFSSFRGQWIEDTPARRQAILQRLRTWNPFSDSSPVEGIIAAIREFYDPSKKISIYVLGDDFTGNSIRDVVNTVDRINTATATGERLVRIHAIGFPVQFAQPPRYQETGRRFAALMRELARKNGGTFVGLNDFY